MKGVILYGNTELMLRMLAGIVTIVILATVLVIIAEAIRRRK